ncbi:MAG: phosphatase PAP2 family protein [Prevotellaceae bacterium]|nr:phosphatase PAP2 family protein [Prevotellaceae bacterium]
MDKLIEWDKYLLLRWNGSDSVWLDGVMWHLSDTRTWALVLIVLLVVLAQRRDWLRMLLVVLGFALTIALADQISASLIKPLVGRLRPTHDSEIGTLVDIVHGYRGGRFGFVSSHAANTMGVAVFLSLLVRHRLLTLVLFLWAGIVSYSRIYLGVHYPGDILCGALLGAFVGWISFRFYAILSKRCVKYPEERLSAKAVKGLLIAFLVTFLYVLVEPIFVAT